MATNYRAFLLLSWLLLSYAMEWLDESEYDDVVKWCRYHGHNLTTDDANFGSTFSGYIRRLV